MTSTPEDKPTSTPEKRPFKSAMQFFADRIKHARRSGNAELLRHPTADNNMTMERFLRPKAKAEEETPWDMIRQRPCTPNDQYTVMNQQMIQDIKDKSRKYPIFHHEFKPRIPDKRYYMDRYATNRSQYLLRGQPGSNPHCWLDYQWQREPPEDHSSSRFGASLPWGTPKIGCKTYSHFDGEDVYRYLNIDVYCRPPTNIVENVVSKFGRAPSYYHQRKPHTHTWFGSSHMLNQTEILKDHKAKPFDEYIAKWQGEKEKALRRKEQGLWPEYSVYTDSYTIHSVEPKRLSQIQRSKLYVAEGRRLQELEQDASSHL